MSGRQRQSPAFANRFAILVRSLSPQGIKSGCFFEQRRRATRVQPCSLCHNLKAAAALNCGRSRRLSLLRVKPGFHGSEPPDIRAYTALHEQFPHESTADQWFSESQMESYRGLGSHIIGKLCGSLETARTAPGGRLDIEALARSVTCYLESTRAQPPVVSDAARSTADRGARPRRRHAPAALSPQVTTASRAGSRPPGLRVRGSSDSPRLTPLHGNQIKEEIARAAERISGSC